MVMQIKLIVVVVMITCTDGTRVISLSFCRFMVSYGGKYCWEENKKENEKGKKVVYLSTVSGI